MGGPERKAVLFDLDGTLTDPFEGITASIRHALERMGRLAPTPAELRWCIGPPLHDSFPLLLGSAEPVDVADAIRLYRERYIDVGKFENKLIDGISELLDELVDEGVALFVATSKPVAYARDILEHFDLMRRFLSLYGSGLDGTNAAKADLLKHLLTAENIAPADTIMIGDRCHDIEGAKANGVRSVGVLWGYGDRAELEAAGADWIVERPEEIANLVSTELCQGVSAGQ